MDEKGVLAHGEIALGDQVIMLAMPSPDYQGPKKHREQCEAARKWSQVPWIINGVMVMDVRADAECGDGTVNRNQRVIPAVSCYFTDPAYTITGAAPCGFSNN